MGRIVSIFLTGRLSDKFGRKPFVYLGIITYILFFVGILISRNIMIACIFGVIAGIANSCLGSGTYPALMEAFPQQAGTANVLTKAAIQLGQFALPIFIGGLISFNLWYGWSFMLAIAILVLNFLFISRVRFPDEDAREIGSETKQGDETATLRFKSQPKMWLEGVAFVIYGFTSQATFYLISQYINQYGQYVAG